MGLVESLEFDRRRFRSGVNTATYMHYIDFADRNGIEYVILDDGWAADNGEDLMKINPEIDLPAIIAHAREKGVDIILWAVSGLLSVIWKIYAAIIPRWE